MVRLNNMDKTLERNYTQKWQFVTLLIFILNFNNLNLKTITRHCERSAAIQTIFKKMLLFKHLNS